MGLGLGVGFQLLPGAWLDAAGLRLWVHLVRVRVKG